MTLETEVELLRIPEVARRLGISRAKAYDMAARQMIPVVRLGDRALRVPSRALAAWIVLNTTGGDEEGAHAANVAPWEQGHAAAVRTPAP